MNVTRVVQTAQYLSELVCQAISTLWAAIGHKGWQGANVTLQLVPGLPHQIHEGSRKLVECWMAELDSDSACLVAVTENGVDESAEHYANFVYTEQVLCDVVVRCDALLVALKDSRSCGLQR